MTPEEKKAKQDAARAAYAKKQSDNAKKKNQLVLQLDSGEAWTEWYSRHPEAD